MNKQLTLSLLSLALCSSLFSAELSGEQNVFPTNSVNKEPAVLNHQDNTSNRKIVETVEQYKAYMDERDAIRIKEEQKRILQMNEQSCDINKLKSAVAKIIKRLDSMDQNNSSTDITALKDKIKMLELQMNFSQKNDFNEPKKICSTKKIPVKSKGLNLGSNIDNESSYLKFKELKTFKTQYEIPTYKYPAVNSEILEKRLKTNEEFKADMYTKFGWVHIENGGWVKGYALSPRFMPSKIIKAKAIEYKEVTDCQIIK